MLHDSLKDDRTELISRCRSIATPHPHAATAEQLLQGVPLFLNQLVHALRSLQSEYAPCSMRMAARMKQVP